MRPANEMRIDNQHGASLSIRRKTCGAPDTAYEEVFVIAGGSSRTMPLSDPCIDLGAVGPDGAVVGRQDQIRVAPGATWIIR